MREIARRDEAPCLRRYVIGLVLRNLYPVLFSIARMECGFFPYFVGTVLTLLYVGVPRYHAVPILCLTFTDNRAFRDSGGLVGFGFNRLSLLANFLPRARFPSNVARPCFLKI